MNVEAAMRVPGEVIAPEIRPRPSRPWWLLPLGRFDARWWWPVGCALIVLDYALGSDPAFPVFYTPAVIAAAWYSGRTPAAALAIAVPAAHALLLTLWWKPEHLAMLIAATAFRGAAILLLGVWFRRLADHEAAMSRHIQALEGLLPICSFCKSIRNDAGEWERLEAFITRRSAARFSHAFCPVCERAHYPELPGGK